MGEQQTTVVDETDPMRRIEIRLERIEKKLDAMAKPSPDGRITDLSDDIRRFVSDRCGIIDATRKVKTSELYRAYSVWCGRNSLNPCHETTFGKVIRRTFPHIKAKYKTVEKSNDRYYFGIGLNHDWYLDPKEDDDMEVAYEPHGEME